MGQVRAAHVEGGGIGGHGRRVVDEHEAGVGVDAAPDQPCTGRTVHVHAGPCRPFHGAASRARPSPRWPRPRCPVRAGENNRAAGSGAVRGAAAVTSSSVRPRRPAPPGRLRPRPAGIPRRCFLLGRGVRAAGPDLRFPSGLEDFLSHPFELFTCPSRICPAPIRRSRRQTEIRGVDGSQGIRYASRTQSARLTNSS